MTTERRRSTAWIATSRSRQDRLRPAWAGARRWLPGALGSFCLCFSTHAPAQHTGDIAELFKKADAVKLANYAEFTTLLKSIDERAYELSAADREYLSYLKGWDSAYRGHNDAAIAALSKIVDESKNATLQFRAAVTVVNVLSVSRRYEEAFSRLNRLLDLLPQVQDKDAREQALLVTAFTYVAVGQHDLTLRYAQMIIDENHAGRGICKGGQVKLQALYSSGKIRSVSPDLQKGIDNCVKLGELTFANTIRTYAARLHIDQGRYDDAIALLNKHYDEVIQSQYRRIISAYDALLAEAYRKKGSPALAKQFGLETIKNAVPGQYTEPLVNAYNVLYEVARDEGDFKAALAYHENYATADKAYLDDSSARHLAYQKVTHENIANKLQLDALNKQNQVLQLERQLHAKAMEASRLYIALLALIVVFIGLWAYRTKRSQLHFRNLSQLDGLTGISNRPYFIEQAQKSLENATKTGEHICIVLCDLDHFKSINDSHGHAAGDHVLKRAVSECRAHLGPGDIFGRFGGEEFGILLPTCDPAQAWQLAEQLRVAIAAITIELGSTEQGADASTLVTASFGIATTGSSGYELRQLLAHADAALYEAKRTGRNRVVMHDGTLTADVLAEGRKFAAG